MFGAISCLANSENIFVFNPDTVYEYEYVYDTVYVYDTIVYYDTVRIGDDGCLDCVKMQELYDAKEILEQHNISTFQQKYAINAEKTFVPIQKIHGIYLRPFIEVHTSLFAPSMQFKSELPEMAPLVEYRNKKEENPLSYSYAMVFGYTLGNWNFSSGLITQHFQNLSQYQVKMPAISNQAKSITYFPTEMTIDTIDVYYQTINRQPTVIYATREVWTVYDRPVSINNQVSLQASETLGKSSSRFLGIPLLIERNFHKKNVVLGISAGVVSSFFVMSNQLVPKIKSTNWDDFTKPTFKKIHLTGLLGFSTGYKINNHWQINLKANYQRSNNMLDSSLGYKQTYQSLGLNLGLRYNFF